MKAKLIKQGNEYFLRSLIKDIPSSINVYHKISEKEGEFGFGKHSGKLSKQNCDEVFGVVNVEKLAEESWGDKISSPYHAYIEGFNKAIELNKDKVFTEEDVRKAYIYGVSNCHSFGHSAIDYTDKCIQSLQQPTEIEVEILMINPRTGNIVKHDSDLEWDEDGLCDRAIPKLDSEGCLILKKI
jgi:hypothetical protein